MRYTVVDPEGTVSFVGPPHVLKMLVAACAQMPTHLADVLGYLKRLDRQFAEQVANGLAVFDEHHVGTSAGPATPAPPITNVFRVIDAASRQASLQPMRSGVVLFNLPRRRIVQIQNSYAEIDRQARGRLRRDGRPVPTFYSYNLPSEWSIVP
jgi:hypothetical protein